MTNNHIIALLNLRDKVVGRGYSPHHNNQLLIFYFKVNGRRIEARERRPTGGKGLRLSASGLATQAASGRRSSRFPSAPPLLRSKSDPERDMKSDEQEDFIRSE